MILKPSIVILLLLLFKPCFAQEIVQVLQPVTYSYFEGGQHLSDSTVRYFLRSKESRYLSNNNTYLVDFNVLSGQMSIQVAIDTIEGYWKWIAASYELLHIPLENGNTIIGSNGFECDITIADLVYVTKEGEFKWFLNSETGFLVNGIIDTIGFVADDVIAVIDEDSNVYYYNFDGEELFYQIPPVIYFNIISANGFYYGLKEDGVYKLNGNFEPVDSYPVFNPISFHHVDSNAFVVSTESLTVLLNTNLDELNVNFQLSNVLSVAKNSDFLWFVTPDGLFQTTKILVSQNYFSAEPSEIMHHVWAFQDTVYVASEYDGIRHWDMVLRKYGPGITATNPYDVSISSLYIDTVTWVQVNGGYGLRFDSVVVELTNNGQDTIKTCVINWDWKLEASFSCSSIYGESVFKEISIPPGESQQLQLEPFITQRFLAHIDPNFCFWVDFPNRHPDVLPENNIGCFEAQIINHTSDQLNNLFPNVYPNPTSAIITIQFDGKSPDFVDIYSTHGEVVHSSFFSGNKMELNIANWPAGVYYIVTRSKHEVNSTRFIKQ